MNSIRNILLLSLVQSDQVHQKHDLDVEEKLPTSNLNLEKYNSGHPMLLVRTFGPFNRICLKRVTSTE